MKAIKVEFLSRQTLREMKPGHKRVFSLPTRKACESAKQQCYNVANADGTKYSCEVDYDNQTVRVERKS